MTGLTAPKGQPGASPPSATPTLRPAAFYGLLGRTARQLAAETEADEASVLLSLLVAWGNIVGPTYRMPLGSGSVGTNLYVAVLGRTGSRKSEGLNAGHAFFSPVIPGWSPQHVLSGLSSGEGLIQHLVTHAGEPGDVRLLIKLSELGRLLRISQRGGETLSMVIREAWDGGALQSPRVKDPVGVDASHVSVIANITPDELAAEAQPQDWANGLINRFVLCYNESTKELPLGGEFEAAAEPLRQQWAAVWANLPPPERMALSPEAATQWRSLYHQIRERQRQAVYPPRLDTHILKLAMAYALADASTTVHLEDLAAGACIGEYHTEVLQQFQRLSRTGNDLADTIWWWFADHPDATPTRTEIQRKVCGGHTRSHALTTALQILVDQHLVDIQNAVVTDRQGRQRTIQHFRLVS